MSVNFLFTPPSCRPRGLPQVRETLRTQGPAGFPPRGNPRLTCKDFGDPRVNSSQFRQAGRQAGIKTSRPAHRSASTGAPRKPPIKECWSQDNLLSSVPGTTRGASQCRQDIASTDDDGTTDHMTGRPLTRRDVWTSRHQRRVSRRCWPTTETGLTDTRMQVDGRRQHAHAHVM